MSEGKSTENSGSVDSGRKSFSRSLSNRGRAYSESDGGSFEFDIALAFNESDVEKAERVLEELQQLVLQDDTKARVCLYNDETFGGSTIEGPSRLFESCRFVFVLMTNNTTEDDKTFRFFKNEVLGKALHDTKNEEYRVRVLHTEPKSCRKYKIPDGLNDPRPLDWHEPMDRAKSEMVKLLSVNRKITSGGRTSNGKSKEKKEMTPQARKIRDDSNCVLKKWQRELYCPTLATHASMETLKRRGSLLISGRSGDGKTATAYHILTELTRISPTFQPFIIHKPEDLDHIQFENSIIFIDNIFGVSHFSSVLMEKWKIRFHTLEAYVDKGSMYFLATSSCHVIDSCTQQINNINLLSPKVDMAVEYRLNSDEKREMLTHFIKWNKQTMKSSEIERAIKTKLTLGFPQCCKLYVSNTEAQKLGAEFFEKPFIFLNDQISKFDTSEIKTDRVSYQILLLCVFQKGQFSSESLKAPTDSVPISPVSSSASSSSCSSSSSFWSILNEVCSVTNCSFEIRRQAAKNLVKMGLLIYIEQTGFYEFSHQSIYDAVCISLGKKDYVKDVLELAPAAFLVNNTSVSDLISKKEQNTIFVSQVHRPFLIDRINTELKKGNIKILEHSMFCQKVMVEELFKRKDFADALTNMLKDHQQVFRIWHLNFLYFLSASQKYQTLILKIIDILKTIPEDGSPIPMEFYFSGNVGIILGVSQLPTSFNEVHKALLHQCFEGVCYSGDLRIFHQLRKRINPCNNCFLKAVESHIDHPQILLELLSRTTEFYIDRTRLVSDLVRREKLKSLESVLKSDSLSTDTIKCAALVLLKEACMAGNFETFDKLKNRFGFPDNRHYELLFSAVRGGDIRILKMLITDKNKNCLDEKGRTLLHLACEKEQPKTEELVDFLIAHRVTTTTLDKKGRSALHLVCKYKDLELLKKMIYNGVEVTVTNTKNIKVSPLHMAAQNEKGSLMVDVLIEKSPKELDVINFQDGHGQTPLHIAAQKAWGFQMIEKLLEKKANHTIRDEKGQTALHKAAEFNLIHIMRTLINHDVDLVKSVDNEKKTSLHLLLSNYKRKDDRKSQTVELLLQAGTDVHLADKDGNTVLHITVESQAGLQVLRQLLGKFTRDIALNKKGLSPLHCLFGKNACQKSIDLLLAKFPSLLKTPTADGRSVLHVALQNRSPYHIIDYILRKPSVELGNVKWQVLDVEVMLYHFSAEELTQFISFCAYYFPLPVKIAIYHYISKHPVFDDKGWREICDLLDIQNMSTHPFLMFDILSHPDRIEYLVEQGISVNVVDSEGRTPLHASVLLYNSIKASQTLIKAGADVNKADNTGTIPLLSAVKINFLLAFYKSISRHPFNISLIELIHKPFAPWDENDSITQPPKEIMNRIVEVCKPMNLIRTILFHRFQTDAQSTVSLLLDNGSIVNIQDNKGLTPIHYSVYDEELLTKLVKAEGDLKLTTHDGWSCLHMACLLKNRNAVRSLLENGLSLFTRDSFGVSPFQVALFSGADDDLIQHMLSLSDTYQPHEHDLHLAALYNSRAAIEKLIDPKTLFTKDSDGHLPIFYAILNGKLDIAEMLLQAMRQKRMTNDQTSELGAKTEPLSVDQESIGTVRSKTPTLKALLETIGNVDTKTFLHIASTHDCPQMLQLLVNEGFHVNLCDEKEQTPLHVSVKSFNSDNVEYLLSEGAEVDCVDKEGNTPLMYACMTVSPSFQVVSGLIRKGASATQTNRTKRTAMHFLVSNQSLRLLPVKYLCSDPSTVAALKVFKLLIDHVADVNAKDQRGQTPLHLAAAADNTWFVSILLDHGADIDALDSQGICPLQCALGGSPMDLSPCSLTAQYFVDRGACLDILDQSALTKLKAARKTIPGNPKRLWKEWSE